MNISAIESAGQAAPSVLYKMDLDAGVPSSIDRNKIHQWALDRLRRGAHPKYPGLPGLEGAGPLAKGLGVSQQTTSAPKQIVALRRQAHPSPEAIEQLQAQLRLERVNLSGRRRLSHIEASRGASDAAGIRYRDKGTEIPKVHPFMIQISYWSSKKKFIRHIKTRRLSCCAVIGARQWDFHAERLYTWRWAPPQARLYRV
jgi:hypothetical protein